MRDLGLDGLSEDRRFLIARDPSTDEKFRIPADHRLASLIGKPSHSGNTSGQLEIRMESSLSPRDIQTRIRRGETPQAVADSAGVPVEQILGFAGPVLAEREYMCEQARKTSIRRKHVGGAGVLLGTLVTENIAASGGVPEAASWDSWRREDGRWTVQVTPEGAAHPASFLFDVKSRYVVPADEFAHDLVGDVALPDSADMAIADAVRAPARPAEVRSRSSTRSRRCSTSRPSRDLPEVEEGPQVGVASLKEARDRRALEQLAIGEAEESDRCRHLSCPRARGRRLRGLPRARCRGARHVGPPQEAPRTPPRPELGRDHVRRQDRRAERLG